MAIRPHSGAAAPGSGGELALLLATEARLEELLRRAREEAQGIVAAARADAAARDRALAAELEGDLGRLAQAIDAEYHGRAERLAAHARGEAARFDGTGPDQVAELARSVVRRVSGAEP